MPRAGEPPAFRLHRPTAQDHSRWAQANLPAGYLPRLAHRDDIAAYLARLDEPLRAIDPSLAGGEELRPDEDGVEVISRERETKGGSFDLIFIGKSVPSQFS